MYLKFNYEKIVYKKINHQQILSFDLGFKINDEFKKFQLVSVQFFKGERIKNIFKFFEM